MHGRVVTILAVTAMATGCSDVCGTPDQLDGRTFASFATVRTIDELTGDDAFPASSTPANGPLEIAFDWASNLPQGPLTVILDGQVFEDGSGQWSQINCGNFTTSFGGTYDGEDGAVHDFVAAGYFVQYDSQLEGFLSWEEGWETEDGSGRFEGEVLLRGEEL